MPADQLHQKADRSWGTGAFAQSLHKDSDDSDAWVKKTDDTRQAWGTTVSGLDSYPGAPAKENLFDKTGLLPCLYQSYFKSIDLLSPFYDPSPQADDKTKKAVLAIGDPLYTNGGTSQEQEAWKLWKKNSGDPVPNEIFVPRVFAEDARIFLASGGFPRTAPTPESPEFRIAVEDLKARFASCAWHDPVDPDRVLGKEVAQASAEWQLWATYDGGHTLRNPNSVKCLEVLNGSNADGTKIQIRDCGGAKAQQWKFDVRSAGPLVNAASGKCLHLPTFDNSKDAVSSTCNG
ncbi:RICIN domain-containing protein [Streptomyces sp. NPDC048417]|uniref:RICIN domain-containing protein n=1 Tax=Streptomyces sp. NPDC048417 TaxID=3155387 RepID=UPI003442A252